jgi:hypothetical protein
MFPALLVIAQLFVSSAAYELCDKIKYPYAGRNVSVAITASATKSITVDGANVPVTIGGTITVVDGCTFQLSDFVLSGPKSVQWFGASSNTDPAAVRLTNDDVPATTKGGVFTFITSAGNWVSYNDFTQINVYDAASKSVVGHAVFPPASRASTPTTTARAPAATTSQVAKASETAKTSDAQISRAFGFLVALGTFVMMLC